MKKLAFFLFLVFSPVMAQTVVSQSVPSQDVVLTVNQADLGLIGKGLGTLPYNDVTPLFAKLQGQIAEQQKKKEEADKKPVDNAQPNK